MKLRESVREGVQRERERERVEGEETAAGSLSTIFFPSPSLLSDPSSPSSAFLFPFKAEGQVALESLICFPRVFTFVCLFSGFSGLRGAGGGRREAKREKGEKKDGGEESKGEKEKKGGCSGYEGSRKEGGEGIRSSGRRERLGG